LPPAAGIARAILRTGAAQLLVLGAPAHAVVSETVGLARNARSAAPFASLMNAVLRKVSTDGPEAFRRLPPGSDLPDWLYARWSVAYGRETAATIATVLRQEPPLDLTVKEDTEYWSARLGASIIDGTTLRLQAAGDIAALPGFAEGAWWVQDAAAARPVRLLGDIARARVLDLCAAPGGKTMQLAAAGAHVTALDIADDRLTRLRENLERTRLQANLVCADARSFEPGDAFDIVVLDAPCTATGTLRRHPDAAWLRRPSDIPDRAALQRALLDRARTFVKPGGRLLYAVCSLEPEEGPDLVAGFLADRADMREEGPSLRTTPADLASDGGVDGFYATLLRRASS
jgi:16S rRNA (cytosine967-C5)-methyltransferase